MPIENRETLKPIVINFKFDFSIRGVKYKEFTNLLNDVEHYMETHCLLFSKIIPKISENTITELKNNSQNHTHPLKKEKGDLALKILKEIVKKQYNYDDSGADLFISNHGIEMQQLWQISYASSNGLRIVGYFINNIFYVLFFDYNHLLEPSDNYNQTNYNTYSFCPLSFLGGDNNE